MTKQYTNGVTWKISLQNKIFINMNIFICEFLASFSLSFNMYGLVYINQLMNSADTKTALIIHYNTYST
jgi:hypothetical protein